MSDGLKLLIFSVVVFGVAHLALFKFEVDLILIILLSVYFSAFTWIFNRQLQKAYVDENKNRFTQVFMGFTGVKLFTCLILLAVFLYLFKEHRLYTGLYIMGYYLLYTFFEVALWRGKLKK